MLRPETTGNPRTRRLPTPPTSRSLPNLFGLSEPEDVFVDRVAAIVRQTCIGTPAGLHNANDILKESLYLLYELGERGWGPIATDGDFDRFIRFTVGTVEILASRRRAAGTDAARNDAGSKSAPQPIPPYSPDDNRWISNKEAARLERILVSSLASYRQKSKALFMAPDGMSGIDRYGQMWRRIGGPDSSPLYFAPSLRKARDEAQEKSAEPP